VLKCLEQTNKQRQQEQQQQQQHWHRQLRDSDADKQTNLQTGHPKGGGKGVAGR